MLDAFLHDIVTDPHDLTPRLVLADWLEEHGQLPVQTDLAKFIRLMVKGGDADMRAAERLLRKNFLNWWAPTYFAPKNHIEGPLFDTLTVVTHGSRGLSITFRNGFVERLLLPCSILEEYVGRLFTTCPLKQVVLIDRHPVDEDRMGWCWYVEAAAADWPDEVETASLPRPIFDRLPPPEGHPEDEWRSYGGGHTAPYYADANEARDALSTAIITRGREIQGLLPLRAKA